MSESIKPTCPVCAYPMEPNRWGTFYVHVNSEKGRCGITNIPAANMQARLTGPVAAVAPPKEE